MTRLDAPDGILMPTLDSFYERTNLAVKTQPQEGKYFFLPGKGWGTEIAIRGQVMGRKKHSRYLHTIPYRSHSDFELYAVPENFSYTEDFKDLFGSQETYRETQSKMFGRVGNNTNPIPEGYLKKTSEITNLNGNNIKTLNLEFLFADKLISEHYEFNKPNNHGRDISDSACLALLYDLDINKVKKIINDFYIQPQREFFTSQISSESLKKRAQNIVNKINSEKELDAEDRYIASITSYTQAFSFQEIEDLYNDESKWNNGKLKSEEALKIVQADLEIYKKNTDNKLKECSQENIFKKIDAFFAINKGRRHAIDMSMTETNKYISTQKMYTTKKHSQN